MGTPPFPRKKGIVQFFLLKSHAVKYEVDLSTFCYTNLKTSIFDKIVHHQKCVNARLPSWPTFYKVHKRHFFVTLIYRSKLIFQELKVI